MALEGPEGALEGAALVGYLGPIAGQVDVDAAAAELRAEVPEDQQLIGPDEDVDRVGEGGQGLEAVQLVAKLPAAGQAGQMVGLVDQEGRRSAAAQGLLQRASELRSGQAARQGRRARTHRRAAGLGA